MPTVDCSPLWIASHSGADFYTVIDARDASGCMVFLVRVCGVVAQIETGNRLVGNDHRAAAIRAAAKRCARRMERDHADG